MIQRIKQYIFFAIIAAICYFFLSHHIIYYEKSFYLLNKSNLTFSYTFYSIQKKKPATILKADPLREDGMGDLLVELGLLDEEEKEQLEEEYSWEEEDDEEYEQEE